ncbi:hypothetical protein CICLE_v10006627mg, partial [Citrus x clementina]
FGLSALLGPWTKPDSPILNGSYPHRAADCLVFTHRRTILIHLAKLARVLQRVAVFRSRIKKLCFNIKGAGRFVVMGLPHKESTFSDEDGFEDEDLSDLNEEAVYNRDGLEEKLQDIGWPENAGWIHKLTIDIDQEQEVYVNDDLKREASFYTQALEGTRQAFEKLQSMGLPFLRPADYYAEMVKSDAHMEKVKCRLLSELKEIEEAEERKKAREAKKLAKEIQVQKTKERVKQKKEEIESVKKWRKQRQQSGFAGEVDNGELDLAFEGGKSFDRSNKKRPGVSPGDRSGGKARKSGGGDGGKGKTKKNRDFRNSKFGFGGKKSMKKQNTADTTDDLRGFSKGDGVGNKRRKR